MSGVDHVGERSWWRQQTVQRCRGNNVPLKLERDRVHNVHVQGDPQTNGTLVPTGMKSQPQTPCRLPHKCVGPPTRTTTLSQRSTSCCDIHGITTYIEGEALDTVIHQNAEIVSQERARDAKCPGRRHDECLPSNEKRDGDEDIERSGEDVRMRLF